MKAKEYYEKYKDRILGDPAGVMIPPEGMTADEYRVKISKDAASELVKAIHAEVVQILKDRHCKKDSAVVAVIREENQKWNAIIDLFTSHGQRCPLRRDGIIKFYCDTKPELKQYFEKKES